MEIPESINNLTVETPADQFTVVPIQRSTSINDVINLCRQYLPYQDHKSFDEGISFYKKDTSSDRNFIKNLCYLFNDTFVKAVQTSNIEDTAKVEASKAITAMINGIILNIDSIYSLVRNLNADKNIIDVQKISCIILGYVIDIIKRKNITKV